MCSKVHSDKQAWTHHVRKHFPPSFFCPVCCAPNSRPDSLRRHFGNTKTKKCGLKPEAKRFGISQREGGRNIIGYSYFNLYWLGGMDAFLGEFRIDDEIFEILAGRERGSTIYPPFMTEGSAEENKILQELGWID